MISGKKVLAIIPARGGSKGLPRKNILKICGKPLIAWTIEKSKKSKYLDAMLVTTDDLEIADVAINYGAYVPFIRPSELASDTTTALEVVQHAIEYLKTREKQIFDLIVWLEPTSPLREDDDIDNMLFKLINDIDQYDSIISLGEVSEHPAIIKRLVGSSIEPFCGDMVVTTRRQDNELAYFPYGVAYIAKTESLLAEKTFYTKRCTFYTIKRYQNYEIDDLCDFYCVEAMMKRVWGL